MTGWEGWEVVEIGCEGCEGVEASGIERAEGEISWESNVVEWYEGVIGEEEE